MHHVLPFIGLFFIFQQGWGLSWTEKAALYQDCRIFNDTRIYGGPLCGSDGVTYANSVYLDCANYRNFKSVATMHSGGCLAGEEYCKANLYYEPVCGSDGNTYTNFESLLCVNYKHLRDVTVQSKGPCEKFDHCYRNGLEFYGINPVCGSNGLTYQNAAQVKCLQRYNSGLKILHDGGCSLLEVHALYEFSEKVCDIAHTRYEWNPMCASDGVTYPNPFVLICYHSHLLLEAVSEGECETSTYDARAFIENDTEISKNDEVCGSDGLTYKSIRHLDCRTSRDKYLAMKHPGPCSGPDDNPCGSIPEEDHKLPICGSDGISYVSPEALWCAKLRSPERELTFVHDGPC